VFAFSDCAIHSMRSPSPRPLPPGENSLNQNSRIEPLNQKAPPLPAFGHPLLHSEWRRGMGRGGARVHGKGDSLPTPEQFAVPVDCDVSRAGVNTAECPFTIWPRKCNCLIRSNTPRDPSPAAGISHQRFCLPQFRPPSLNQPISRAHEPSPLCSLEWSRST
jgi:hypothetical protein